MFWHDDVSVNASPETLPHVFTAKNEEIESIGDGEFRLPPVATECQKVTLPGRVQAIQSSGHGRTLTPQGPTVTVTMLDLTSLWCTLRPDTMESTSSNWMVYVPGWLISR